MSTALHHKTPLFYSHALSNKLSKDIYFKMDCHQPTGSFKIRGVGKRCQEAAKQGAKHFVIASGGNAGLATAYAGWKMNIKTTVVVPSSTKSFMRQKIADLGAEVIVHGEAWDESNTYAQELVQQENTVYIPPFDHPTIWEGNASVIDECHEEMTSPPDLVIVSVGGGGLFCGIVEGVLRNHWNNTKIIAAETEGAASLKASIEAKELVTLEKINSIASSLGAKTVAKKTLELALKHKTGYYTVSDVQALNACKYFLNETGVLVEPACGAALAAVYENLSLLQSANSILVIACGGAALSFQQFDDFLKK